MVASGVARVTVRANGQTYNLEATVNVTPRDGWTFSPVTPVQRQPGYQVPGTTTVLMVADPRTGDAGTGKSLLTVRTNVGSNDVTSVTTGPNQGLKYVLNASDGTMFDWGMHPDIEDPVSDWYQNQCGTWIPAPGSTCDNRLGTGLISGLDYLNGTRRHEQGPQNSHWRVYADLQSDPANNVKAGLEDLIGPASATLGGFMVDFVTPRVRDRMQRISSAFDVQEPCSQHCSDDCRSFNGPAQLPPYRVQCP